MIYADAAPGTHPTIDLGCGTLCTLNYDSVISSLIAVIATIAIAFWVRSKLQEGRPGKVQAIFEWGYDQLRGLIKTNVSDEALFIKSVAPHVALGLRLGLVIGALDVAEATRAPGVVLLSAELAVTGWTPAAEQWLDELGFVVGRDALPPTELLAVAARLGGPATPDAKVPSLRVRTAAGR